MKLPVVLLLVAFFETCYGIHCYECTHFYPPEWGMEQDESCRFPEEKYLKECTEDSLIPASFENKIKGLNLTRSAKTKGITQFSCINFVIWNSWQNGVLRLCAPFEEDYYLETSNEWGGTEKDRICNTDGCNNDIQGR